MCKNSCSSVVAPLSSLVKKIVLNLPCKFFMRNTWTALVSEIERFSRISIARRVRCGPENYSILSFPQNCFC
jgi:hypothetical protein